jgi:mono/diheme cytochrome c family protein
MPIRRVSSLAILFLGLAVSAESQQKQIKYVPVKPTSRTSAQEMYPAYCALCHGIDGKGGGPAAEVLKVPPSDLTTLARRNGGKYPSDHVTSAIRGDLHLPAHGSREMPAWGREVFWRMSQGQTSEVQLRVSNLNKYIESLQAK